MGFIRPLLLAFSFLTIIPIEMDRVRDGELGRSVAFFPVVGMALGGVLALLSWLGGGLPPLLLSLLLVAALALLSGGLHLDGLADLFDGQGGGRGKRERVLEIMSDSHIGAHGVVALVLVLMGQVIALTSIIQGTHIVALAIFPGAVRWSVIPLIVFFRSAKESGLGSTFHSEARTFDWILSTLLMIPCLALGGTMVLVATFAALSVSLAIALLINSRLRGLTGDVHGACIELSGLAYLIAAAAAGAKT